MPRPLIPRFASPVSATSGSSTRLSSTNALSNAGSSAFSPTRCALSSAQYLLPLSFTASSSPLPCAAATAASLMPPSMRSFPRKSGCRFAS